MSKRNRISQYKNFGYNVNNIGQSTYLGGDRKDVDRNLKNYISPVQLTRLKQDISTWRDAMSEAERAYYPMRVKQQRLYIDTVLDGHVKALMERRKDLTLLRSFKICDSKGEESETLTQQIQSYEWFQQFVEFSLDSLFYGYSLISLGDIVNDEIENCTVIPRWFVSPDRYEVSSMVYGTSGINFREKPQSDWHIYVPTANPNGNSPCGMGLLYDMGRYEIYLRNNLGYNADFTELFAMPYRIGKTTKSDEDERSILEQALRNMGSAGYAILDPQDEIEFLDSKQSGTGYKAYESLETRCNKILSKIVLGHADAVDSTPGKLGSGQGSKDGANEDGSPVQMALNDKQTRDARFIEPIINKQLFPRLRELGFNIPKGYRFEYVNDNEDENFRAKEDASNLITAQIAQTMKSAGLQMDENYFSERTGITASKAPDPIVPNPNDLRNDPKVKNRLKQLYK